MTKRSLCLGQSFDPRNNALNLLRLVLAILVIFSHAIPLGGFGSEVLWGHVTLGGMAVDGFFAVSGFLIGASALRNTVPRFLWQRFLRIFPAYWVCLVVTATVAGPINWLAQGKPLKDYWTADRGPLHYVLANALLRISGYGIAGGPTDVPYPKVWNGSLWTLWYEFMCYLMVAALSALTLLRRRRIVLCLWVLSWALAAIAAFSGIHLHTVLALFIRFTPIYFAGVVLWLYRDKIPDSKVLFGAAVLLFVAGTFSEDPHFLAGPPLAYVCIWASVHLPGKTIGTKYDISYGVYIYAFVIGQVLATLNVHGWGYWPFCLLTLFLTAILAAMSCVWFEQPALRLKHWSPRCVGKKSKDSPASLRPDS